MGAAVQYGPANKKPLIWASLRFLLGRHLQTTLSTSYYIGFSVEFTTEPFFFQPNFPSFLKKKNEHSVLIGHFLIGGPIPYAPRDLRRVSVLDGTRVVYVTTLSSKHRDIFQ